MLKISCSLDAKNVYILAIYENHMKKLIWDQEWDYIEIEKKVLQQGSFDTGYNVK